MFELCNSIVPTSCRGKGGTSTCERTPMSALMVLSIIWCHIPIQHQQQPPPPTPPIKVSHETSRVMALCGVITLPVCLITREQLAATLLTHEHHLRFDFEIDAALLTDIHDHPLDCTGERPGILARIITCDRFATIAPNV